MAVYDINPNKQVVTDMAFYRSGEKVPFSSRVSGANVKYGAKVKPESSAALVNGAPAFDQQKSRSAESARYLLVQILPTAAWRNNKLEREAIFNCRLDAVANNVIGAKVGQLTKLDLKLVVSHRSQRRHLLREIPASKVMRLKTILLPACQLLAESPEKPGFTGDNMATQRVRCCCRKSPANTRAGRPALTLTAPELRY